MATMGMLSPRKRNAIGTIQHAHAPTENDGFDPSSQHQRPMSEGLREVAASPMSVSSRNRSQGFPLCNSRAQLQKMKALYDDVNHEEEHGGGLNQSLDHSYNRDYSEPNNTSREESRFYLKTCLSTEEGNNALSPLYTGSSSVSSTASVSDSLSSPCSSVDGDDEDESETESDAENDTDSDFLTEARASLRALQEWQDMETIPSHDSGYDHDHDNIDVDVSSCDASCNSSYDGNSDVIQNFDAHSACGYDDFHYPNNHAAAMLDTPRSCPEIYPRRRSSLPRRPASTKSWLQEIKDEEFQQRKRIADAIAASSGAKSSNAHNNSNTNNSTPTILKRIGSKSSMLRHSSKLFRNKENRENETEQRPAGKQKLMRSMRLQRSWQTPPRFARRQQHRNSNSGEGVDEDRDDHHDAPTAATPLAMEVTAAPLPGKHTPAQASPVVVAPLSSDSSSNNKDWQLKRAFLGSARVLTMDGIVESFAAADTPSSLGYEGTQELPSSSSTRFAPTSDAPLSWV